MTQIECFLDGRSMVSRRSRSILAIAAISSLIVALLSSPAHAEEWDVPCKPNTRQWAEGCGEYFIQELMARYPELTYQQATASAYELNFIAEEENVKFYNAAEAVLANETEVSDEVAAAAAAGQGAYNAGAADVVVTEGTDDPNTDPDPVTAAPATQSGFAALSSGGPSGGSSTRLKLPRANRYGDMVVAPNKTSQVPHGHAAIFVSLDYIVHARGSGFRVSKHHRLDAGAQTFAPGAQMMSVYTDEGDGPLLSFTKRKMAATWAEGRVGDQYRSWSSPNASRVTGSVGSSGSTQNCSQLLYGAYNYANGYEFNPVAYWTLNPGAILVDKNYVHPFELIQAPQTKVYKKVYRTATS